MRSSGPAAHHRRGAVGRRGVQEGRADSRRHRRPGDLRLLHLHRPGHAGGLRLLRQGRRRRARRQRSAGTRRDAAHQHRRRPAVLVLPVGNDAVAGSRHAGPGPGRPAAGPPARDRDRQRQRRSARPPRDCHPRSGAMTAPAQRTMGTARRDDRSAPWFDALARDILLIRRCPRCGTTAARTPPTCPACHADELEWGRSRGTGTVVSVVFDHGGRIRYPSASSSWTRARGWLPGSSLGRRHRPAAG